MISRQTIENGMILGGGALTLLLAASYLMPSSSKETITQNQSNHNEDQPSNNQSEVSASPASTKDHICTNHSSYNATHISEQKQNFSSILENLAVALKEADNPRAREEKAESAERKLTTESTSEKKEHSCNLSLTEVENFLNSEASLNAPLEKFMGLLKDLAELKGDECMPLYKQVRFLSDISRKKYCFQNKDCKEQALSLLKTKNSQIKN